jgi:DNA topoisomerase IB
MLEFARALPGLRRQVQSDLERGDLSREQVLACAVRLLDIGFFRIGGEDYAARSESYGLATLRKRHVNLRGDIIIFDYPAKGGKRRLQSVVDPEVAGIVSRLRSRRGGGPELLAYRRSRRWVDIRSGDINEYLKAITDRDFSAKDFRTWNATVLAAVALAVSGAAAGSRSARERAIRRAVGEVAHYMGNTPAVARSAYIDPRVLDRFRDGLTIAGALPQLGSGVDEPATQGPVEDAVVDLLAGHETGAIQQLA